MSWAIENHGQSSASLSKERTRIESRENLTALSRFDRLGQDDRCGASAACSYSSNLKCLLKRVREFENVFDTGRSGHIPKVVMPIFESLIGPVGTIGGRKRDAECHHH